MGRDSLSFLVISSGSSIYIYICIYIICIIRYIYLIYISIIYRHTILCRAFFPQANLEKRVDAASDSGESTALKKSVELYEEKAASKPQLALHNECMLGVAEVTCHCFSCCCCATI